MKNKEFAAAFGLRVEELCDLMGCTRTTLIKILKGSPATSERRLNAMIKALEVKSAEMWNEDVKRVKADAEQRRTLIQRLKDLRGTENGCD